MSSVLSGSNSNLTTLRRGTSGRKIVPNHPLAFWRCGVVIIMTMFILLLILNVQLFHTISLDRQASQEPTQQHQQYPNLLRQHQKKQLDDVVWPMLLPQKNVMPAIDPKTRQPRKMGAMHRWAIEPITGTFYSYPDHDVNSRSPKDNPHQRVLVHMPWMDIQHYYFKKPASLEFLRKANPKAVQSWPPPPATDLARSVVLTRKGHKFTTDGYSVNQDRIAIREYPNKDLWMGLFDGHGDWGHITTHYLLTEFPKRMAAAFPNLIQHIKEHDKVKQILRELFLEINEQMPHLEESGSTGISIWKHDQDLIISNLGDSKAFVVGVDIQDNAIRHMNILYVTKPHKPDDPLERYRIETMGGQVADPPFPGATARVIIPVGDDDAGDMGLAMSRCFGDFEGHEYGVVAEPTTDILSLKELDPNLEYLIILASDGLFDMVNEFEIAREMAQSQLLQPGATYTAHEAAERLILMSSRVWKEEDDSHRDGDSYRDDISLAVHHLKLR